MRVVSSALLVALASAVLAVWLDERAPEAPPAPAPPVAVTPAAPAPLAAAEPAAPMPKPAAPPPVSAAPPPAARAPRAPVALPEPARVSRTPAPAAPAEEPLVTLDQLLELPTREAAPEGFDWADEPPATPAAARERRVRVDFSRKQLHEVVPTQPERRRTDVGVSVPVDEAERLRVRGSVRIDEREGERDDPEREATPSVGVEVRF